MTAVPAAGTLSTALLAIALAAGMGCNGSPPSGEARVPVTPPVAPPAAAPLVLPAPEDPGPSVAECRAGNAKACAQAAQLYYGGWGVPRDMARVAVYAGPACQSGIAEACTLRDLAYFKDHWYLATPGVQQYRMYIESLEPDYGPPWCTDLKSRDAWGYAAYYVSNCYLAEAQASNREPSVPSGHEQAVVQSACFDKADPEACRGMILSSNPGTVDGKRLAPLCRDKGIGCDAAEGATSAETLKLREKGCLGRQYEACGDWVRLAEKLGSPFDLLVRERIVAQVCLHPIHNNIPVSVDLLRLEEEGDSECRPARFTALAASSDPSDQALLRALGHAPEGVREADCKGTFYNAETCRLFVLGVDDAKLGSHEDHMPEGVRWSERIAVLGHLCEGPLPSPDKDRIGDLCKERKRIEDAHKAFLARTGPL